MMAALGALFSTAIIVLFFVDLHGRYWDRIAAAKTDAQSFAKILAADSDEVARVYRYEVARGFRDDVAHLSDLISPGGEAF